MKELFANFEKIEKNDPEFHEIFENFAYGEVFEYSTLNEKDTVLVTLASLIACQSPKAFKKILISALDKYITPCEVKELLYQSVAYVGFGCAHNFFGVVIKVFDKKGIEMPLENRSNTTAEDRHQKGREIQDRYFGVEMIQAMNDNAPEGQQHFNTFLEGYCFGDFYTRDGLNDQQRELITFTFIATLGGCENQLRGHTQGNLSVGNDKEKLVSAITVMLPYIGFPRTLNALAIVNEICD
ncbi:carboxymuconolactone decarboxylase family protein [Methanobrevibacter sp.]|uniref:carboxymuconolactone decarboxylase family protein n=1 Tax=Methanobrevibacter sp. TaxID=66852 RepID=UPI0025CCBFE6|nr:carboxymuconolactone decarboxylase family protein [Methanobrevibacter sp.]MBQ2666223.1 carboxymuconolactone decarboxylase family protein [Methanobrevibacter sp.]